MKNFKGFTILETLLYISLFSFVFIGIVEFALVTGSFTRSAEDILTIERSLIFIDKHVEELFEGSDLISDSESVFFNNSGVLSLTKDGVIYIYRVENGRLTVTYNSQKFYLSPIDYFINSFYIEPITYSQSLITEGVRISISINSAKTENIRELKSLYFL